jgi:hypothetical protein
MCKGFDALAVRVQETLSSNSHNHQPFSAARRQLGRHGTARQAGGAKRSPICLSAAL